MDVEHETQGGTVFGSSPYQGGSLNTAWNEWSWTDGQKLNSGVRAVVEGTLVVCVLLVVALMFILPDENNNVKRGFMYLGASALIAQNMLDMNKADPYTKSSIGVMAVGAVMAVGSWTGVGATVETT